jgi:hypothetical protein
MVLRTIGLVLLTAAFTGCLPIDRTPVESTPIVQAGLDEVDRIGRPASGPLFAGVAREDITPSTITPLAGYGARLGRPARGVHDRLFARALALRAGDRVVVLISVDLLAITNDLTEAVVKIAARDVPIATDGLVLTATHTHSGPGAVARRVWESFAAGEYDETVFRTLAQRIARAAIEAYRRLEPAELAWAEAAAPERITNRMIPGGFTDPALSVLAVRRAGNRPFAYLVNFSAHATVLKADNFLLSGDYPGAVERALERDGAIALFTAGAVADQTAAPSPAADRFAAAETMGEDLARRATDAVKGLSPAAWRSETEVGAWRVNLALPKIQVKTSPRRRIATAIADVFFDRRSTLAFVAIADRVLIGVPCDLSATIGAGWKAEAKRLGRRAVILGFTNDYVGYVIPTEYYETGHYEARMSFNGPFMDRYFTAVVSRALARLGPR